MSAETQKQIAHEVAEIDKQLVHISYFLHQPDSPSFWREIDRKMIDDLLEERLKLTRHDHDSVPQNR